MWPTLQAIDRTILAACGCGLAGAMVAATQLHSWPIVMEEDHSAEPDFIKTKAAFILGLVASVASLAIGFVRMKFEAPMHSKTLRLLFVSSLLASFLCLLVAVAVWGDFIKHGERNALHRNELRWSYWLAVVADVFQFLGFLLYIIRSDFKDAAASGATSTGVGGGVGRGGKKVSTSLLTAGEMSGSVTAASGGVGVAAAAGATSGSEVSAGRAFV